MKRAQIAIFLITGVIILLGVTITLVYINYTQVQSLETATPTTPLTPIDSYVQTCLELYSTQGLKVMGSQGGYYRMPDEMRLNPSLAVSYDPTRTFAIPFYSDGQSVNVPEKSVFEQQLVLYLEDNIGNCLNNLTALQQFQDVSAFENPQVEVSVNAQDVTIAMDYEIARTEGRIVNEKSKFIYRIPVKIEHMLTASRDILRHLSESDFIEDLTIDLMATGDTTGTHDIPISGMEFTCGKLIWLKSEVQNRVQDVLAVNLPNIRVAGGEVRPFLADSRVYESYTAYHPDAFLDPRGLPDYDDAPRDIFEYLHMYTDAGNADLLQEQDLRVAFSYIPDYGMDFQVRPSNGNKMEASAAQGHPDFIRFFCMQTYHFTYDVSYPYEIALIQDDVFYDRTPFILKFANRANIKQNAPYDGRAGLNPTTPTVFDSQVCEDVSDTESIITVVNAADLSEKLDNVSVRFECYKYACDLGTTQVDAAGDALLRTNLPIGCFGGFVRAYADGYEQQSDNQIAEVLNVRGRQENHVIIMNPLQNVDVQVLGYEDSRSEQLLTDMRAVISVEDQYSDYESYGGYLYTRNAYGAYEVTNDLELLAIPTTYDITVLLYKENDWIGGYIGELNVEREDIGKSLYINTYIFDSDADPAMHWVKLEDGVYDESDSDYRQTHTLRWQ